MLSHDLLLYTYFVSRSLPREVMHVEVSRMMVLECVYTGLKYMNHLTAQKCAMKKITDFIPIVV